MHSIMILWLNLCLAISHALPSIWGPCGLIRSALCQPTASSAINNGQSLTSLPMQDQEKQQKKPSLSPTSLSQNKMPTIKPSLSSADLQLSPLPACLPLSSGCVHLPCPIDMSIPHGLLPLLYDCQPCVHLHMVKSNCGSWLPSLRRLDVAPF